MTVGELKAKLAHMPNELTVTINAENIKLGDMGMNPGSFYAADIKKAAAFGFGQVAEITASVN